VVLLVAFQTGKKILERKGEKKKVGCGVVTRGTRFGGWAAEIISPFLKVPRQCPLVLLI
jgi:hypothetical protein